MSPTTGRCDRWQRSDRNNPPIRPGGHLKSPPSPPTLGPTYLSEVTSVEVQQRGRYNDDGHYWPVRGRVQGNARIKLTSPFQLGLVADPRKVPQEAVDFAEEARSTKDDFGN